MVKGFGCPLLRDCGGTRTYSGVRSHRGLMVVVDRVVGMVHMGPDGIPWDEAGKRLLLVTLHTVHESHDVEVEEGRHPFEGD